jgi:hypothetical protein
MTGAHFVGAHGAAAAALAGAGATYDGPSPQQAVVEALEEAGLAVPARAPGAAGVDTDAWGLAEPAGLCLEEARELLAQIARRL